MRVLVRSLLPLGNGIILDPFMGSGSTIAAASAIGYEAIGIEIDEVYFNEAKKTIPKLAALYPDFDGTELDRPDTQRMNGKLENSSQRKLGFR